MKKTEPRTRAECLKIINDLRERSFDPPEYTTEEYMEAVAKRHKIWFGTGLDTSTPENFIKGLAPVLNHKMEEAVV
jgi:hypothetical protein